MCFIFISGCDNKSPVDAGSKIGRLVISEIHLLSPDSPENWFEIYNPTNEPLTLYEYRTSNVMSMNILPADIRKNGGLLMNPKDFVIICADSSGFPQAKCLFFESSALMSLSEGGYISITTKESEDEGIDLCRYGNPYWSIEFTIANKIEAIDFLNNSGESYERIIPYEPIKFVKKTPTPGY
jgi:hypothetical protein